MSYLVLARKYRPQNFEEIVGQEHVWQTLKNAILNDKVAHAYLFVGPHGVGKTTTARILAKSLNCENKQGANPCNKCSNCIEISEGSSLDVLEIDGASNRGIEEIKQLKDGAVLRPMKSLYKIYIIDEIHMLTSFAFNALLKILEEPPAHVIFIFATTQPQKIPATILSRCQKFTFRLLNEKEIFNSLKNISEKEGIQIKDEDLETVISAAKGSLRDAQVLLDQLISYAGQQITSEDVIAILRIISGSLLYKCAKYLLSGKIKEVFLEIDQLIKQGFNLNQFVEQLIDYFRNILVFKVIQEEKFLILSEEEIAQIKELNKITSQAQLIWILEKLSQAANSMNWSESPRIILEISLFRIAQGYVNIDEVIKRLETLEKIVIQNQENLTENTNTIFSQNLAQDLAENVSSFSPDIDNEEKILEEVSSDKNNLEILIKENWPQIKKIVKEKYISLWSGLLQVDADDLKIENNNLVISLREPADFLIQQLNKKKKNLEEIIQEQCGRKLEVRYNFEKPNFKEIENKEKNIINKICKEFKGEIIK